MFRPGQKLVCIDAKPRQHGPSFLVEGQVYTCHRVIETEFFDHIVFRAVQLVEMDASPCLGWWADRFRPATDISIFKKLLAPTPKKKVREDV